MNIEYLRYNYGPLHMSSKLSEDILKVIDDYSGVQKNKSAYDWRKSLAGKLDHEYSFTDEQIKEISNLIKPYISAYLITLTESYSLVVVDQYYKFCNQERVTPYLNFDSIWVNFQQKGEYNPIHQHSGDISFIIYLDVPSVIYEEENDSGGSPPGSVEFINSLNQVTNQYNNRHNTLKDNYKAIKQNLFAPTNINTLSPTRGDIHMFPSWLNHQVQALKSDVLRTTVAGNIIVDIKEI